MLETQAWSQSVLRGREPEHQPSLESPILDDSQKVGPKEKISFQGRLALVVDDDDSMLSTVARLLRHLDFEVTAAADGAAAIRHIVSTRFDIVISALSMQGEDGFEILKAARKQQPQTPVIILTGTGGVPDSVRAMRAGAYDFLTKPIHSTALGESVCAAMGRNHCSGSGGVVSACESPALVNPGALLLGKSAALQGMLDIVEQVGPTDATILISGETGSGKEIIARLLHASSPRAHQRLVAVNCAAIPENLIESELFGHVKGAFTGAHENHIGKFREANGGTLLLDEVGELPLAMQARLLRVLQDHIVTPVGAERSYTVDVRFLAATNRDLDVMVQNRRFRQDLFFRLNVVPIRVPPLRERLEDVPQLAAHFLELAAGRLGRPIAISEKALAVMQAYGWPGNVRELENLIERMAIFDRDGVVDLDDIPPTFGGETSLAVSSTLWDLTANGIDLCVAVGRFERALIETAMRRTGNNKAKAAIMLGIGRTTLIEKIRRLR
jgi:DNA-binding NtrC family response regulator